MPQAIRTRLPVVANMHRYQSQPGVANAGLELSRYQPEAVSGDKATLKHFLDRVCTAQSTPLYRAAYARWQAMLDNMGNTVAQCPFAVRGRMIVGLGGESVRETAVALQHVYGLPHIPGSALKGLAAHYAARTRDANDAALLSETERKVLFGGPDAASFLTYFDAWYVPGTAQPDDCPLRRDVITVHHPTYYRSQGNGPGQSGPWDFDDPTPIAFLSATGHYLVAVRCVDKDWAALALEVLTHALADWGIGAKTSSGYGRLTPVTSSESEKADTQGEDQEPERALAASHPLLTQILTMSPRMVRPQMNAVYQQAKALDDATIRAEVAAAICARLEEVGALPGWSNKAWVAEVMSWRDAGGGGT